jgi:Sec-independent protein translocase protein TatA
MMKKYLWIGIALLFVSGNASGFRDIDKDTHSFLSDLKEASGSDDDLDDEEEINEDVDDDIDADEEEAAEPKKEEKDKAEEIRKQAAAAVSYTHLTLPTTPYV